MQSSGSSSSRMLKFIWGKGHQPNAERLKVQKDLFGFQKDVKHGFPNKPTSMAWDGELRLLALATKLGAVRIYGTPGVEFYGEHEGEVPATQMLFIPGHGRLVTLTEDNFLHLWEIKGTTLVEKKSTNLDGRLKKISSMCLEPGNKLVLLGTEGGNIYHLNLTKFSIDENIIYQDIVMKGAPDDFKINPGAVETLSLQPNEPNRILIGYARGLIVLWDRAAKAALQTYVASQQLESVAWRGDGSQFVTAHNDGSYVIWSTQGGSVEPLEPPNTPYGPYPCKAINKILWANDNGNSWIVFGGGMPRASYGDKCTVTVMKGEDKHTVFDLTSKVVDFLLITDHTSTGGSVAAPQSLIILAEEEVVAIDMTDDAWPVFPTPYLNSIHASAVTCLTHVADVDTELYRKIGGCSKGRDPKVKLSSNQWPVCGGKVQNKEEDGKHDLLVTGHEDGSVKIWSCGGVALAHVATVRTNKYFVGDDLDEPRAEEDEEDEWPPFRKVGHYDPYSDDPRLAVKKLSFCAATGRLVIGGTAGQVVVCELSEQAREKALTLLKSDLVTEKEGFAWKGHSALNARATPLKMDAGYQPSCVLQISPPASINSLGSSTDWGLVSAGTAHGLVVLDVVLNAAIITKCTLNAQDIANADDNPMSRRKSLKKSLRESFRRLRKGRSQRNVDKKRPGATTTTTTADPIKKEIRSESPESRPLERQIEARSGSEDGLGSMVRCLHFAHTFIANPHSQSPTLWAGTNSGQILVFLLTLPKGDKRKTDKASAMLGKEIQLKHKAPVIAIEVVDSAGLSVQESGGEGGGAQATPHKVLIASEEQLKTFLLPTLKPCGKYKLTAHEGSRIRRIGLTTFQSRSDKIYRENCFIVLTNQGDLAIHSLPDLRRQVQTNCMKKEDVIAISTLVFTRKGEGFYMCSASELQRISVAASHFLVPSGTVDVVPGSRVDEKEEEEEDAFASTSQVDAGDAEVARQNKQNEMQAKGVVSGEATATSPTDVHNETTLSEISGDITLDSVRDHTMCQTVESSVNEISSLSRSERTEVRQVTTESVSITKTTSLSVAAGETTSAIVNGESQVQVLSESFASSAIQVVNQDERGGAPFASRESNGNELPSFDSVVGESKNLQ